MDLENEAVHVDNDVDNEQGEEVFKLIQILKHKIKLLIDSNLTIQQIQSQIINFNLIQPLILNLTSISTESNHLIYSTLIVRLYFINQANLLNSNSNSSSSINLTRADFCELLAIKLLSLNNISINKLLLNLTTYYHPFQNLNLNLFNQQTTQINNQIINRLITKGQIERSSALEIAIYSKAKRFIQTPQLQIIVSAIYSGALIYHPTVSASLMRDDYKLKSVVEVYDFRSKPFLDHYRLRVPSVRSRIEFFTFLIIIILFIATQTSSFTPHYLKQTS
jgi:hypothetical protein